MKGETFKWGEDKDKSFRQSLVVSSWMHLNKDVVESAGACIPGWENVFCLMTEQMRFPCVCDHMLMSDIEYLAKRTGGSESWELRCQPCRARELSHDIWSNKAISIEFLQQYVKSFNMPCLCAYEYKPHHPELCYSCDINQVANYKGPDAAIVDENDIDLGAFTEMMIDVCCGFSKELRDRVKKTDGDIFL